MNRWLYIRAADTHPRLVTVMRSPLWSDYLVEPVKDVVTSRHQNSLHAYGSTSSISCGLGL